MSIQYNGLQLQKGIFSLSHLTPQQLHDPNHPVRLSMQDEFFSMRERADHRRRISLESSFYNGEFANQYFPKLPVLEDGYGYLETTHNSKSKPLFQIYGSIGITQNHIGTTFGAQAQIVLDVQKLKLIQGLKNTHSAAHNSQHDFQDDLKVMFIDASQYTASEFQILRDKYRIRKDHTVFRSHPWSNKSNPQIRDIHLELKRDRIVIDYGQNGSRDTYVESLRDIAFETKDFLRFVNSFRNGLLAHFHLIPKENNLEVSIDFSQSQNTSTHPFNHANLFPSNGEFDEFGFDDDESGDEWKKG
jgi:hypothetical protein